MKLRITKNKRLNLATTPIRVTKTCSNAVENARNAPAMVIDSAEKNDVIALESVLVKRISKECVTMLNDNGSMKKPCKQQVISVVFETTST